jgi:thiol-disulfide isomerase/thioredoxin
MARLGTAVIAVGVAAFAGLTGFLAFRSIDGSRADRLPALRPLAESAAPELGPGGTTTTHPGMETPATAARPIPDRLPDFELATREGPPRRLSSFNDPVLIVNFWATWCAPCRREIPLLNRLQREFAALGVEVVGVAVDFREDVLAYAERIGIDYALLIGEEDGLAAAQAFGMRLVLPFTVFADAERRIVALKVGELHDDEARFIVDRIAALNAGSTTLAEVRPAIRHELAALAVRREAAKAAPQS